MLRKIQISQKLQCVIPGSECFFSLPAHADDALLRACGNAKTAKDCQLPFQQGLSPVQMALSREPLWGYVDTTGHMVIRPDFSEARGFVNDLAAAKKTINSGISIKRPLDY